MKQIFYVLLMLKQHKKGSKFFDRASPSRSYGGILRILIVLYNSALFFQSPAQVKGEDRPVIHQRTIVSQPFLVDRIIPSMQGPFHTTDFKIYGPNRENGQLAWLTSIQLEVLDAHTSRQLSEEFLCHANINSHLPKAGSENFPEDFYRSEQQKEMRILDLVQGHVGIQFPKGFGVPIMTGTAFNFGSMVVNNNPLAEPKQVVIRASIHYVMDSEAAFMKPLKREAIAIKVPVEKTQKDSEQLPLVQPSKDHCDLPFFVDRDEPYHWLVPPGKHVYRRTFAADSKFLYDTTVHYIAVHLHSYAISLELWDRTLNQRVFMSQAKNYSDRIGISHLQHYSSEEGIPVYRDHEYELVSVYHNPTESPVDAMAIMYLYYWDKKFDVAVLSRFVK
jgi:hypothetical protein